ncbi:hypothetical protein [Streptacidiphilus rugosus]|uniref:hypothetical protein n=1 Tax=Streptacidiphilus rugosus TaxID=405783 RepID=UPI00055C2E2E|nr:hypothetical protein [Streptacidiphilus rugosus]
MNSNRAAVPGSGAVLTPATQVSDGEIGVLSLDHRAGVPVLVISGGTALPAALLLVDDADRVLGRYEAVVHQPVMRPLGYLGFAKETPGITDEGPRPPMVVYEGTERSDAVRLDEVLESQPTSE